MIERFARAGEDPTYRYYESEKRENPNRKVFFVMSGPAHLPYLVVCLQSLRKYWDGEVAVYAWPECLSFLEQINKDLNLGICVIKWKPDYRGKNDQFLSKQRIAKQLHPEVTWLYLDADTLVSGSLNNLFEAAETSGFVATQFNNWTTNSKLIKGRILNLKGREGIEQLYIDKLVTEDWPSVNGGIFACKSDSPALSKWEEWTSKVLDVFIADETVLHAITMKYRATYESTILLGGKFNCSPKFQPDNLKDEDIKVFHGHGDCFVRPNKSPKGFKLWWPLWQRCLQENIGRCRDWIERLEGPDAPRNSWKKLVNQLSDEQKGFQNDTE